MINNKICFHSVNNFYFTIYLRYSADDNRYDLRPFVYPKWDY